MGNVTKVENKSIKLNPDVIEDASTQVALGSKFEHSQLLEWKCIFSDGTLPLEITDEVAAFSDGNKIYFLQSVVVEEEEIEKQMIYSYDTVTKQFELFEIEREIEWPSWIYKVENKVYFITEGYLNIYDVQKQITRATELPEENHERNNVAYCNRSIYIFSYIDTSVMIFNIDEEKWSTHQFQWPSKFPAGPSLIITAANNNIYSYGGSCVTGLMNDICKFDCETLQWSLLQPKGDTPEISSAHSLSSLNIQGVPHLVSVGGYNGEKSLNVIQLFNLATMEWTKFNMHWEDKVGAYPLVIGNTLYLIGGHKFENNEMKFYNSIYVLAPKDHSLKSLCLDVVRENKNQYNDLQDQLPNDLNEQLHL